MAHVDQKALQELLKQILALARGHDRALVLAAYQNAIANLILEGDPMPGEAAEMAILTGTEIAAKLDRYFKNLAPRPGPQNPKLS